MTGSESRRTVIATITLVREPREAALLRRSMEALGRVGYAVTVCDGGSGPGFVEFLRGLPGVSVTTSAERGLVGQIRGALAAARELNPAFVLYTESDKLQFFEWHLRRFIARAPLDTEPGAVLAARSPAALATFPPMQRRTEAAINTLCGEFLCAEGDYSFGPFLLRSDVAGYLDRMDGDLGWGWRHFAFAVVHRLRLPLIHVVDDFDCPEDQRHEDEAERLHRVRQLGQNVNGLVAGLTVKLEMRA